MADPVPSCTGLTADSFFYCHTVAVISGGCIRHRIE
jgi:hypothetical protein